jgi:hypothetical protein
VQSIYNQYINLLKLTVMNEPLRSTAMTWWNSMSYEQRFLQIIKHKEHVTGYPNRTPLELTGREVELLYEQEHPSPINEEYNAELGDYYPANHIDPMYDAKLAQDEERRTFDQIDELNKL